MAHEATFDVVVVGMGGAGIAAALTAQEAGANVVVLEKTSPDHAGGNSRVSGQVWFSPHDVDLAQRHLHAMSWQFSIADELAAAWARETSRNTQWLKGLAEQARGRVPRDTGDPYTGDGTDFAQISWGDTLRLQGVQNPPEDEYDEVEGHDCGSDYNVIGGSMGFSRLWLMLKTCLDDSGIDVRYNNEVLRLVADPDGAITGVVVSDGGAEHVLMARRGVVLATGGFAANPEMARNYLRLPNVTPWGNPACTGDGIRMAQKVGADLSHPYNYMAMPGIAMPPYGTGQDTMPGARFINVGADGRRLVDESVPNRHGKSIQRGMFDFDPGVPMWTIFDEEARLAGPLVIPRAFFAVGWIRQIEGYEWSLDNSAEIERGWITRADSIAELADKLNIDPKGLEAEIEQYNALAESGSDDPVFGRPAHTMRPIARPPFYGYEWAQLLMTTLGGIRKDEHARAVDPFGAPIPGLYCAGDVSSSYSWCLSGGMGLGDALAFGRIAGGNAASR
ncbi:FAD-dependent oxidoreductase [Mycobacterium sp. TNTM28]|uniref:FAD-dependent oxidoreductase n=1 Tax=[Mycobacterium] fortunisiensis TaxID=2600579 RepID=A0ABS6KHX5_9MYCO|nr:FAD-dependent oxidoreductase [[Mycobacterium] fortunisiensis]MBU9763170.1 FAD-dependent oxidoreductase [[Mycobacterium] fortunisiensis]